MNAANYPSPIDKLLSYATCEDIDITSHEQWPDYLELGFGPEHIPDLIRLATDTTYSTSDSEDPAYCAPVHAWRILGLLHAAAAIEPLIPLTEDSEYGDIASDELPEVYGLIGPAAIPALKALLADSSHTPSARIDAVRCIERIAKMHPEAKEECIAIITHQLELFAENDPEVNAFLIFALKELKVPEAMPLIKQAYEADSVDEFFAGTFDEVQVAFGLKERTEKPRWGENLFGVGTQAMKEGGVFPLPEAPSKKPRSHGGGGFNKNKAKNKSAKQSRKKNRRRK
ncbi:MAG: HEAT repeat domain-containing protein [Ktedonobacteraceae bacterium]